MIKDIICLRCPRGCEIHTTLDGYGQIQEIHGNVCRMGEEYTRDEVTDPRRILCSTVRVKQGVYPLVPVWTSTPIPKERLMELAQDLRDITLTAPVKRDQTVIQNWKDTGVDIVCSGEVEKS